jgi:hypothetical protein
LSQSAQLSQQCKESSREKEYDDVMEEQGCIKCSKTNIISEKKLSMWVCLFTNF